MERPLRVAFAKTVFDENWFVMDQWDPDPRRHLDLPFLVEGFGLEINVVVVDESMEKIVEKLRRSEFDAVIVALPHGIADEQVQKLRCLQLRTFPTLDEPSPSFLIFVESPEEERILRNFALALMGSRRVFRGY